jgi:lysozyme family protein
MQENYANLEARELVFEGGLVNNPKDPGGLTNKGVTQATYNSWRARQRQRPQSVALISAEEVAAIYKGDYWDRVDGDELPAGVDFCMFDASINSGVGGATEWAQAVLGLPTDGDFGPKTRAAILAEDPEVFVKDFCSRRLGTLKRLNTWGTFGNGWSARIANVQRTSLAMIQQGELPDPIAVHTIGGHTKAKPGDVPVNKTRVVAAHITTAGGAVGTAASAAASQIQAVSDTFTWIKYVFGALTIVGAGAGMIVYFGKTWDDQAANAQAKAKVDTDADLALPPVPLTPPAASAVGTSTAEAVAHG